MSDTSRPKEKQASSSPSAAHDKHDQPQNSSPTNPPTGQQSQRPSLTLEIPTRRQASSIEGPFDPANTGTSTGAAESAASSSQVQGQAQIQGQAQVQGQGQGQTQTQAQGQGVGTSNPVALPERISLVPLQQRAWLEELARQGMEEVERREKEGKGEDKGKK